MEGKKLVRTEYSLLQMDEESKRKKLTKEQFTKLKVAQLLDQKLNMPFTDGPDDDAVSELRAGL